MEHLKIIQTTEGNAEEVSMDIVQKLYDIASSSTLDNESDLQGKIHLTTAYRPPVEWLREHFPNLIIDIDKVDNKENFVIEFEDPNMLNYLLSLGIGSNGVITEPQAIAATVVANSQNTTIKKFNELKYFTQITGSAGGWNSGNSGVIKFRNWTALEEIDISNFTSIGHIQYATDDSFWGCTSLKTVKASDKLTLIGPNAFSGCTNLESITGLSGAIVVKGSAFYNCAKLTNHFANCTIILDGDSQFKRCTLLQNIHLNENVTAINSWTFSECKALQTDLSMPNITSIGAGAFLNCFALSGELNIPNLTTIDNYGGEFNGCDGITKVKCLGKISFIPKNCFRGGNNTKHLAEVYLPYECTTIDETAFYKQTALTTVKQYNKSIDQYAEGESPVFTDISRVTSIGREAFAETTSLNMDASALSNVKTFSYAAFFKSNISGTLTLSGNVYIESSAFFWSNITGLDLSATTLTNIDTECFYKSSVQTAILPTTITKISSSAFRECDSLTTVNLSSLTSLVELGANAFYACRNLVLGPSDVQNIQIFGNICLRQTKLAGDLVLPNVSSIDNGAFEITEITSCDFTGSTFTKLSTQVFRSCSSFDHLIVNASVTQLGEEIVQNCNSLRYIKFLGTTVPTQQSNNSFGGMNNNVKIYVPDAALTDYQAAGGWSNYASRIFPMSQFATDFPNG